MTDEVIARHPVYSPILNKHKHDLPPAWMWKDYAFRCSKCNKIFQSVFSDWALGFYWKPRSERWLKRKLRKLEHD